jgi:hypothetical protein
LSTFGAESFIKVVKTGPSSIRLVRAAAVAGARFVGAELADETLVTIPVLIRTPIPVEDGAALETEPS